VLLNSSEKNNECNDTTRVQDSTTINDACNDDNVYTSD